MDVKIDQLPKDGCWRASVAAIAACPKATEKCGEWKHLPRECPSDHSKDAVLDKPH